MGILGLSLTKQFVKICKLPNAILVPIIISVSIIGTYALNTSLVDVIIMIFFGILGYFMKMMEFETAPLVLGMVLCNIFESNFRRALILAKGDLFGYLLTRPISLILIVIIALTVLLPTIIKIVQARFSNRER